MAVSSNNKSPSPLSIRSFPPHRGTSENNNSTPKRSFNGKPFSRPSVLATHRGFKPELIALLITQSRKKKILVERNNPVRTSITLSDGKATFYSANSEEQNQNSEKVMEPKEAIPIECLPPVTKTPKRVTFSEASLNSESLSDSLAIASLDADPSLPPYDPKTNYLSWYTTLSSMGVSSNKKSPSPLSIISFPSYPRTSENNNSTPRRSFNGNPFLRPSVLANHRGFNPVTPANSHAGELGSSSLPWGFDEKENEFKAAKLKSPAKGSKNFMSLTISASSKITQSRKKKILVERNDPVRTSITLSDGKASLFSANSEEHYQNSKMLMEPKETVLVDGFPSVTKTAKRVTFLEASLNSESLSDTVIMDYDICNDEPLVSPAIASLDVDPSLPPYDPKTNYLSWYTTLSSMAVSSNNKSPSSLSIRSFPPHP
ncbi:hypothetical protein FXO37_29613 [Capsicum annuum]|nr:hypothetical protein FXO37_29613 [Capsicum annuum]